MDECELQEIDSLLTAIGEREAIGDLNEWEMKFFKDVVKRREVYGKQLNVSDKQYAKLEQMANPIAPHKDTVYSIRH